MSSTTTRSFSVSSIINTKNYDVLDWSLVVLTSAIFAE